MIKRVEGELNGTKEMSKKHFIDAKVLNEYLEQEIENYKGPLTIEEFIGGQSNPTYLLKTFSASYVLNSENSRKKIVDLQTANKYQYNE
mgnify:CR=1 FL=1